MKPQVLGLPPVTDLLVHRAPMVLLERVLEHEPKQTRCVAVVGPDPLFLEEDGTVSNLVAIEYMAQCIAVHAGLRAREAGAPPPRGFLVGSRCTEFHAPRFIPSQVLIVTAHHRWGEGASGAFACEVRDSVTGAVAAEGVLTVFAPSLPGHHEVTS